MLHHYQILIPLLSLFLVRVDLTDLKPLEIPVTLVKILDGDTVVVQSGMGELKVRLEKVDAPEKNQKFSTIPMSAGEISLKCLEKALKKIPELQLSIHQLDIYGRILGDFRDLNFRLIEEGCSGPYPHAQFETYAEKHRYLRSYMKARRERAGVWKFGGYQLPKNWRRSSKRTAHRS